jgi:hypothetical protein
MSQSRIRLAHASVPECEGGEFANHREAIPRREMPQSGIRLHHRRVGEDELANILANVSLAHANVPKREVSTGNLAPLMR